MISKEINAYEFDDDDDDVTADFAVYYDANRDYSFDDDSEIEGDELPLVALPSTSASSFPAPPLRPTLPVIGPSKSSPLVSAPHSVGGGKSAITTSLQQSPVQQLLGMFGGNANKKNKKKDQKKSGLSFKGS